MIFYGVLFFPDTGEWTSSRFTYLSLSLLVAGMAVESFLLARGSAARWPIVIGGASALVSFAAVACFFVGVERAGYALLVVGGILFLVLAIYQWAERENRKETPTQ